MHPLPYNTALLVIDLASGFGEPVPGSDRSTPQLEHNVARLERSWRASGRALIRVGQQPRRPGRAADAWFRPPVSGASMGTSLGATLRRCGVGTLVLAGVETDRSVSTIARMAAGLGFTTYVVSDATATCARTGPDGRRHHAADVHSVALAELNGEFATVVDTDTVLAALRDPASRPDLLSVPGMGDGGTTIVTATSRGVLKNGAGPGAQSAGEPATRHLSVN